MLGLIPMKDILDVLKYIDEIKEYDKEVSEDIYYGSLHDSFYDNYIDDHNDSNDSNGSNGSTDTQYDEFSFGNYSTYSNEGYYFLTESY